MSFIAAVFAIPIRDFPTVENGSESLPFSYVSKFIFGVGLAISIPLIAIAFAVDEVALTIRRCVKFLIGGPRSARSARDTANSLGSDNSKEKPPLSLV